MLKEEFTHLSGENLDSAIRLAQVSMESAEKLVRLQLEASRMFVEENVRNAKSLAQAKTPEDIAALRGKFAESSFAKAMEYSRSLYEIAAETQAEFKQIVEQRMADYGKDGGAATQNASALRAGADLVSSALKATMAASTAAMDTLTQAANQISSLAESAFLTGAAAGQRGQQLPPSRRKERESRD